MAEGGMGAGPFAGLSLQPEVIMVQFDTQGDVASPATLPAIKEMPAHKPAKAAAKPATKPRAKAKPKAKPKAKTEPAKPFTPFVVSTLSGPQHTPLPGWQIIRRPYAPAVKPKTFAGRIALILREGWKEFRAGLRGEMTP